MIDLDETLKRLLTKKVPLDPVEVDIILHARNGVRYSSISNWRVSYIGSWK